MIITGAPGKFAQLLRSQSQFAEVGGTASVSLAEFGTFTNLLAQEGDVVVITIGVTLTKGAVAGAVEIIAIGAGGIELRVGVDPLDPLIIEQMAALEVRSFTLTWVCSVHASADGTGEIGVWLSSGGSDAATSTVYGSCYVLRA